MTREKYVRALATRAIRLNIDDEYPRFSFEQHEKTIVDNMDFLYWLIRLAQLDEREACAKVCDNIHFTVDSGNNFAKRIRARGNQ